MEKKNTISNDLIAKFENFEPGTRELTLQIAARLFNRQGYSATTLRQIAKAANIKAGSIYYHFESKEQILDEVLDKGLRTVFDLVRQKVEALPEPASARERLEAAIEGHLWAMLHLGDFASANIKIYEQIPMGAKDRHRLARRSYANYWDRLLGDALKQGLLSTDCSTTVIRLFVIGSLNATIDWYNPNQGSFKDFVEKYTSLLFEGIFNNNKS